MARMSQIGKVATTVKTREGKTYVTYHSTDVVIFDNEKITLCTGGWETPTTCTRMNQASNQFDLGYKVYQKAGDWFVSYNGTIYPFDGTTAEFSR